jgi:homoserine kinase
VTDVRARAPASSANLGPGFDTLALALKLYVTVDVEPAPKGDAGADSFVLDVVRRVLGHDRVRVAVTSDIPVARGLGSSAAVAVAAAAAAGAEDPLAIAAAVDGHPENAAASVLGGLVTATTVDGHPVAHRLPLDGDLRVVALIPERPLATEKARRALPAMVSHADAAFDLGRLGLLLAGLADRRLLVPAATQDRLHQPYRAALFPEAEGLLDGLVAAGAAAASWSGAGPTLVAFCGAGEAENVVQAGKRLLAERGVSGRSVSLDVDHDGLTLDPR